jgi:hypothetical protein
MFGRTSFEINAKATPWNTKKYRVATYLMVALVASEYPLDSFLDTVLCQFMELHNEI